MVKKLIACSFEKNSMGGFITISNGLHPSQVGYIGKTVTITRDHFNECCKDRLLFNDVLGIDIRQGWQNALADAINNCQNLKTDVDAEKTAAFIVDGLVAQHGEEEIAKEVESLEKQNDAIKAEMEKQVETTTKEESDGTDTPAKTRKSRKNTRSKTADGVSE